MKSLFFSVLSAMLLLTSCVDTSVKQYPEGYNPNHSCVPAPALPGNAEMTWDFLPPMDTVFYSLEETPGVAEELLRNLQQQVRDCRNNYNNKVGKAVWKEVNWGDSRALFRTGFEQGIGTWSYLGTVLDHPSLRGRRNQNVGWVEKGCRHITHEDFHGAGFPHEQNRIEFVPNKTEYQKAYPQCNDACFDASFVNYGREAFKDFDYNYKSLMHYWFPRNQYTSPNVTIPFTRVPDAQDTERFQTIFGDIEDRDDDGDVVVVVNPKDCNRKINNNIDSVSRLLTEELDRNMKVIEESQREVIRLVNEFRVKEK